MRPYIKLSKLAATAWLERIPIKYSKFWFITDRRKKAHEKVGNFIGDGTGIEPVTRVFLTLIIFSFIMF
jgi:hypothetical protein